jgi:hypothetical protein
MMLINLVGQRFGRLRIVERAGHSKGRNKTIVWLCHCDCGNECRVRGDHLRYGKQISCGCRRSERDHSNRITHDGSYTRLHVIWRGMRGRCRSLSHPRFKDYGGRGIEVCDPWQKFETFRDWAHQSGYQSTLTIDRIDNDGNYEPSNCQWLTRGANAAKRRNTAS